MTINNNMTEDYVTLALSLVTYKSDLITLKKTIDSLLSELKNVQEEFQNFSYEIFVIDNFSTVNYREELLKLMQSYHLDNTNSNLSVNQLDENIGFGSGHNTAIYNKKSQYHLIVNPDIVFSTGSLLHGLKTLEKNSEYSLIAPIITDENGNETRSHCQNLHYYDLLLRSIAPNFVKSIFKARLKQLQNIPVNTPLTASSNVLFSGCLLLFRSDILRSVGGFSEHYFLYFEDYDLSRKTLKKNIAIIDSKFKVYHSGGKANKKGIKHWLLFFISSIKFFIPLKNAK